MQPGKTVRALVHRWAGRVQEPRSIEQLQIQLDSCNIVQGEEDRPFANRR